MAPPDYEDPFVRKVAYKLKSKPREESCPFCDIAAAYPSSHSTRIRYDIPSPTSKLPVQSYPILVTPQVLAFLDIMPLTPGHVLLTPRHHAEKIMDLTPEEGAALGAWLPILTRAVSRAMGVDNLNVVQNNGDSDQSYSSSLPHQPSNMTAVSKFFGDMKGTVEEMFTGNVKATDVKDGQRASQVVPHVHYHIIPRPDNYTPNRSWTMFGKGPRDDIDDEEAALTAARIRQEIAWELETMGQSEETVMVQTKLVAPTSKL